MLIQRQRHKSKKKISNVVSILVSIFHLCCIIYCSFLSVIYYKNINSYFAYLYPKKNSTIPFSMFSFVLSIFLSSQLSYFCEPYVTCQFTPNLVTTPCKLAWLDRAGKCYSTALQKQGPRVIKGEEWCLTQTYGHGFDSVLLTIYCIHSLSLNWIVAFPPFWSWLVLTKYFHKTMSILLVMKNMFFLLLLWCLYNV